MTNLIGIQRRMRELGRIRLGEKGMAKNGKSYPKKLTGFRLTSQSKEKLLVAADLYGGEVRKWDGAPGLGDQWELYMGDRIDVLLPPGEPLTQSFELWSGGGCTRRCDGGTMSDGGPCQCPADMNERIELAKTGAACKPTTRLAVVLPRLPDIGVWRMESHGYNAAVELPGTVEVLRALSDDGRTMIPAWLRIEQRTSVKDGETRHFVVPVLELPTVTVAELMSGNAAPALEAGSTPAIVPPPPAAIAAPAPPPPPPAARAPQPRREEAQRPVAAPPLPGDAPASAATADGISGLVERLDALDAMEAVKFREKFGDPEKLQPQRLVVAEAFVTALEANQPAATPAADDPGRPFEDAPPAADPKGQHPANGGGTVTVKQAQKLHIDASALGISEEDFDILVLNYTGGKSTSAKDVPADQMDHLTDEMQRISERPDGAARMAAIRNRVLEAAGQQTIGVAS